MIKFGKKVKDTEKHLPLLVDDLSKRKNVIAIYLFGSRATNKADDLSDIDIALLMKGESVSLKEELNILGEITSTLHTDEVSLVILNNAPLVIRNGVLKEAKVLYSADENAMFSFEEQTLKQYLDFKYVLDIYDKEFISMMKYGKVS